MRAGRLAFVLICVVAASAQAATRVWTGGGADNKWKTAGNWGGTAPGSGDTLVFAGSSRLTTTNDYTGYSFASIIFSNTASAFTLAGNSLTLTGELRNESAALQTVKLAIAGSSTLTLNAASGDLAVSGVISGTSCVLRKSGTGKLTLSGNNTYRAGTVIADGTLSVSADNSTTHNLGYVSASCTLTFAGGALEVTGGALYGSGQNWLLRNIILGSGGGTIVSPLEIGHENYSGIGEYVSGGTAANGLTLKGGDIVLRPGAQNTLGKLTVDSGRAFLRNLAKTGTAYAYPVAPADLIVVNAGATLVFTDLMPRSITNAMSLASGAVLSTRTVSGSSGAMTQSTANVQFPSAGSIGFNMDDQPTDAITINGAYPALTSDLTIQVGGGNAIVGTVTLNGAISGGHALTKSSPGTLVLNAANAYTGGTTVSGGTLDVRADGGLGSGSAMVAAGATLTLSSGTANRYISGSASLLLNGSALVNLAFTGTNTIAALSFDGGSTFVAPGTWGSAASAASNPSACFAGTGILNVVPPTVTTVGSSSNPALYGQPPGFAATVTTPTGGTPAGWAQFYTNGAAFGGAVALTNGGAVSALLPVAFPAGPCAVSASFQPSGAWGASTGQLAQTVNPRPAMLSGSRAYDGTALADASFLTISNRVGFDDVTLASGSATLAGAGVGAQPVVSAGTLVLGGAAAGNYTLAGCGGAVTVVPGAAALLGIETAADGSGSVVGSPTVRIGTGLMLYAIARDAGGNFVANTNATWSLSATNGDAAVSDFTVQPDGRSACFTGHAVGAARVAAVSGSLAGGTGYLIVPLEPGAIHLPPFEGAAIGTSQPPWPQQTYWINGTNNNQYADWMIVADAGLGGTAGAVAHPGTNARGGSAAYVQALRTYYVPVVSNASYSLHFFYKALGPGFNAQGDATASELQVQVLESPNIDGGAWLSTAGPTIRTAAPDWTSFSYAFTTQPTTRSVCLKFGMLFGNGNQTNATDSLCLDDDPADTSPSVAIKSAQIVDDRLLMTWTGTSAWYFALETATSLVPGTVWTPVQQPSEKMTGLNGLMSGMDTNAAGQRFFRLRLSR